MSILVFAESVNREFKKSSLEVVSYGKQLSKKMGLKLVVVTAFVDDVTPLTKYGADKVLVGNQEALKTSDGRVYASFIVEAVKSVSAKVIIVDSGINGKYVAPMLAVYLQAGYVSNVVDLPESITPFVVKHKVFSNKAFAFTKLESAIKIIALSKNTFGLMEDLGGGEQVIFNPQLDQGRINRMSIEQIKDKVSLTDAEVIVSGGRGLKGGENWEMIEELAKVLEAATACSRPVSDLDWRPHNEHVGQTGKQIAPNLYIAIGISGAIQHLAGVNASKVKVVINKDAEAPFFKAADYGMVADAFEVIPKLTEAIKKIK